MSQQRSPFHGVKDAYQTKRESSAPSSNQGFIPNINQMQSWRGRPNSSFEKQDPANNLRNSSVKNINADLYAQALAAKSSLGLLDPISSPGLKALQHSYGTPSSSVSSPAQNKQDFLSRTKAIEDSLYGKSPQLGSFSGAPNYSKESLNPVDSDSNSSSFAAFNPALELTSVDDEDEFLYGDSNPPIHEVKPIQPRPSMTSVQVSGPTNWSQNKPAGVDCQSKSVTSVKVSGPTNWSQNKPASVDYQSRQLKNLNESTSIAKPQDKSLGTLKLERKQFYPTSSANNAAVKDKHSNFSPVGRSKLGGAAAEILKQLRLDKTLKELMPIEPVPQAIKEHSTPSGKPIPPLSKPKDPRQSALRVLYDPTQSEHEFGKDSRFDKPQEDISLRENSSSQTIEKYDIPKQDDPLKPKFDEAIHKHPAENRAYQELDSRKTNDNPVLIEDPTEKFRKDFLEIQARNAQTDQDVYKQTAEKFHQDFLDILGRNSKNDQEVNEHPAEKFRKAFLEMEAKHMKVEQEHPAEKLRRAYEEIDARSSKKHLKEKLEDLWHSSQKDFQYGRSSSSPKPVESRYKDYRTHASPDRDHFVTRSRDRSRSPEKVIRSQDKSPMSSKRNYESLKSESPKIVDTTQFEKRAEQSNQVPIKATAYASLKDHSSQKSSNLSQRSETGMNSSLNPAKRQLIDYESVSFNKKACTKGRDAVDFEIMKNFDSAIAFTFRNDWLNKFYEKSKQNIPVSEEGRESLSTVRERPDQRSNMTNVPKQAQHTTQSSDSFKQTSLKHHQSKATESMRRPLSPEPLSTSTSYMLSLSMEENYLRSQTNKAMEPSASSLPAGYPASKLQYPPAQHSYPDPRQSSSGLESSGQERQALRTTKTEHAVTSNEQHKKSTKVSRGASPGETKGSKGKRPISSPESSSSSDSSDDSYDENKQLVREMENLIKRKNQIDKDLMHACKYLSEMKSKKENAERIVKYAKAVKMCDLDSMKYFQECYEHADTKFKKLADESKVVRDRIKEIQPTLKAAIIKKPKSKKKKPVEESKPPPTVENEIVFSCFDTGNHWCDVCNESFATLAKLMEHLHCPSHIKNVNPFKMAKDKEPIQSNKSNSSNTTLHPVKGVEFMKPMYGYYCTLCDVTVRNRGFAELHLKGHDHTMKYKDFIKTNPNYESKRDLLKTAKITVLLKEKRKKELEEKQAKRQKSESDSQGKMISKMHDDYDKDIEKESKRMSKQLSDRENWIEKPPSKPSRASDKGERKTDPPVPASKKNQILIGRAPNYKARGKPMVKTYPSTSDKNSSNVDPVVRKIIEDLNESSTSKKDEMPAEKNTDTKKYSKSSEANKSKISESQMKAEGPEPPKKKDSTGGKAKNAKPEMNKADSAVEKALQNILYGNKISENDLSKIKLPETSPTIKPSPPKKTIPPPKKPDVLTEEEQDFLLLGINKRDMQPIAVPRRPPNSPLHHIRGTNFTSFSPPLSVPPPTFSVPPPTLSVPPPHLSVPPPTYSVPLPPLSVPPPPLTVPLSNFSVPPPSLVPNIPHLQQSHPGYLQSSIPPSSFPKIPLPSTPIQGRRRVLTELPLVKDNTDVDMDIDDDVDHSSLIVENVPTEKLDSGFIAPVTKEVTADKNNTDSTVPLDASSPPQTKDNESLAGETGCKTDSQEALSAPDKSDSTQMDVSVLGQKVTVKSDVLEQNTSNLVSTENKEVVKLSATSSSDQPSEDFSSTNNSKSELKISPYSVVNKNFNIEEKLCDPNETGKSNPDMQGPNYELSECSNEIGSVANDGNNNSQSTELSVLSASNTETVLSISNTETVLSATNTETVLSGSNTDTVLSGSNTDTVLSASDTNTVPSALNTETVLSVSNTETVLLESNLEIVLPASNTGAESEKICVGSNLSLDRDVEPNNEPSECSNKMDSVTNEGENNSLNTLISLQECSENIETVLPASNTEAQSETMVKESNLSLNTSVESNNEPRECSNKMDSVTNEGENNSLNTEVSPDECSENIETVHPASNTEAHSETVVEESSLSFDTPVESEVCEKALPVEKQTTGEKSPPIISEKDNANVDTTYLDQLKTVQDDYADNSQVFLSSTQTESLESDETLLPNLNTEHDSPVICEESNLPIDSSVECESSEKCLPELKLCSRRNSLTRMSDKSNDEDSNNQQRELAIRDCGDHLPSMDSSQLDFSKNFESVLSTSNVKNNIEKLDEDSHMPIDLVEPTNVKGSMGLDVGMTSFDATEDNSMQLDDNKPELMMSPENVSEKALPVEKQTIGEKSPPIISEKDNANVDTIYLGAMDLEVGMTSPNASEDDSMLLDDNKVELMGTNESDENSSFILDKQTECSVMITEKSNIDEGGKNQFDMSSCGDFSQSMHSSELESSVGVEAESYLCLDSGFEPATCINEDKSYVDSDEDRTPTHEDNSIKLDETKPELMMSARNLSNEQTSFTLGEQTENSNMLIETNNLEDGKDEFNTSSGLDYSQSMDSSVQESSVNVTEESYFHSDAGTEKSSVDSEVEVKSLDASQNDNMKFDETNAASEISHQRVSGENISGEQTDLKETQLLKRSVETASEQEKMESSSKDFKEEEKNLFLPITIKKEPDPIPAESTLDLSKEIALASVILGSPMITASEDSEPSNKPREALSQTDLNMLLANDQYLSLVQALRERTRELLGMGDENSSSKSPRSDRVASPDINNMKEEKGEKRSSQESKKQSCADSSSFSIPSYPGISIKIEKPDEEFSAASKNVENMFQEITPQAHNLESEELQILPSGKDQPQSTSPPLIDLADSDSDDRDKGQKGRKNDSDTDEYEAS